MANGGESTGVKPQPISGGSTREAELPAVAWRAGGERAESPLVQGIRRFRRSTTALVGVGIVAALLLVAIFADVLAPLSPIASDQTRTFQRPGWDYPLGTDQLGRDMLSRIIHGSRISLAVGVSSVLLALFVGVPCGMVAGYYGGRVDGAIMRVMDLILAFPIYLLAIILMVMFTPTAGLIGTMKVTGAIAIVRIPIYARLVRGSALSIKEKEFIEACRALGVRDHPVQRMAVALPRPRHFRHRARLQSLRRWPPRRARSAAQVGPESLDPQRNDRVLEAYFGRRRRPKGTGPEPGVYGTS